MHWLSDLEDLELRMEKYDEYLEYSSQIGLYLQGVDNTEYDLETERLVEEARKTAYNAKLEELNEPTLEVNAMDLWV